MRALICSAQLDEYGIKRTLQDAIDRYPRLIALRATLRLPDPSTLPREALITRFQAVLLETINAFISQAWSSVIDPPNELVMSLLSETLNCIQVARGDVEMYLSQYAALISYARQLSPVECTDPRDTHRRAILCA